MAPTIEDLLEAPKRTPGTVNSDGTHLLYTTTAYSFEKKTNIKEISLLDLKTGESTLFATSGYMGLQWLTASQLLWFKPAEAGMELWIGNAFGETDEYLAGVLPVQSHDMHFKVLSTSTIAFAFSAAVYDGKLVASEEKPKPASTGREYESPWVRHWDSYIDSDISTLWYTTLEKVDGKYQLQDSYLDVFADTDIQYPVLGASMAGGGGALAISKLGLLVSIDKPEDNPTFGGTTGLYWIPLETLKSTPKITQIEVPGWEGDLSSPQFSPDGETALFYANKHAEMMGTKGLFMIEDLSQPTKVTEIEILNSEKKPWDRHPRRIVWAKDKTKLYVTAEDLARQTIFEVPIPWSGSDIAPVARQIYKGGTMLTFAGLPDNKLFIGECDFVEPRRYRVIDIETLDSKILLRTLDHETHHDLGYKHSQVSEFYFDSDGKKVQCWEFKPSYFKEGEKYPVLLYIHGGPVGCITATWAVMFWNHLYFAEQGYIVVVPNFTGSTSFGAEFTNSVYGNWGTKAYNDIAACFEHLKTQDYADTSRAAAMGSSFGAWMCYWIEGQPLGKELKAIVAHGGGFDNACMLAADQPARLNPDYGGPFTAESQPWRSNNNSDNARHWSTPLLVVHGEKDYCVPPDNGIAAYHIALQRNIEARILLFPDEGHFVQKKENSVHYYKTVIGWLNKWTDNSYGTIELAPPVTRGRWKKGKSPSS